MFEIHITYDETNGQINVNGPVNNKGLCYMMLECARDAVKDANDRLQAVPAAIQPNSNGLPAFVRKAIRRKR